MAKYDINFSCGHVETVELLGKTAERERKISYFKEVGKCSCCRNAEKDLKNSEGCNEIEMKYGEYKEMYPDCKTKSDSYNKETKTIVVYVPVTREKENKFIEELAAIDEVEVDVIEGRLSISDETEGSNAKLVRKYLKMLNTDINNPAFVEKTKTAKDKDLARLEVVKRFQGVDETEDELFAGDDEVSEESIKRWENKKQTLAEEIKGEIKDIDMDAETKDVVAKALAERQFSNLYREPDEQLKFEMTHFGEKDWLKLANVAGMFNASGEQEEHLIDLAVEVGCIFVVDTTIELIESLKECLCEEFYNHKYLTSYIDSYVRAVADKYVMALEIKYFEQFDKFQLSNKCLIKKN